MATMPHVALKHAATKQSSFAAFTAIATLCLTLWTWRPATESQLRDVLQQWAGLGAKTEGFPDSSIPEGHQHQHHHHDRVTVVQRLPAETVFVTETVLVQSVQTVQTGQPAAVQAKPTPALEMKPVATKAYCSADDAAAAEPLSDFNMTFHLHSNPKFDPAGPRPDQVIILTASDGKGHQSEIPDLMARVTENRKSYCDYHGYTCLFLDLNSYDIGVAHPVWKKLPAIAEAFNAYKDAQWVFWLDMDAIIMDPEKPIHKAILSEAGMKEEFELGVEYHRDELQGGPLGFFAPSKLVYENIDLVVTQDQNGLNAGAFFLRRSDWTQWLLDMWTDPFFVLAEWPGQEQEVLQHFVKHHPTMRSHIGITRQYAFNGYPWADDKGVAGWNNDFIVHLAGCWVQHRCAQQFEEYWAMRKVLK